MNEGIKMSTSLKMLLSNITLPNMVYLKRKNMLVEATAIDLNKLTLYKDYVFLPYVKDSEMYDLFLDHYHLVKEKRRLHQSDDFESEFCRFIHYNKKYDHSLWDKYFDFKINYLKPILIKWCKTNKISYVDDVDSIII